MTKSETILEEIRKDKIHGSSYLLEKALSATMEFLKEIQHRRGEQYILFRAFTIKLLSSRREFAVLIRLANDLNNLWDTTMSADTIQEKIKELKKEWEIANHKVVEHAMKVLNNCKHILVHSYSGTVTKALLEVRPEVVFCTESYPGYEGYEQARRFWEMGITTDIIVDTAVYSVIPEVDCVLLGCDAITTEGVFNKIGSTPIAIIARELDKPVNIVTTTHRLLPKSLYAFFHPGVSMEEPKIQIKSGRLIAPLLELIPWEFVSSITIESGSYSPDTIVEKIGDIKVHPVINAVKPEIAQRS